METQPNSGKELNGHQPKALKKQDLNQSLAKKKSDVAAHHHHDYAPRHFSHGRLNIKGIGPDHEPGTIR